uniref:Uncharacterized protein n=1 Tax=Plectus sambesii TaxID=2011161 RepID=A0A914X7M6_9BILA
MSAATPPEDNSNKESPKNAIKCRKCRKSLMEASPDMLNEDVEACCESVQQILSVSTNADEDGSSAEIDYPSWINDQFDTAGWIRGKLLCPNCSAKVGAFNFVGGSRCQCRRSLVPSVYFVRAHVDAPVVTTSPMHQPDSGTASASQHCTTNADVNEGTASASQHCTTNADVNEGCGSSGGQNSNDNYEAQLKQSTNTSHVGFALIHSNEMMNIDSIYDK